MVPTPSRPAVRLVPTCQHANTRSNVLNVENIDRHVEHLNVVAGYVSGMPNTDAATAVAASTSTVCNACNCITADLVGADLLYVLHTNNILLVLLLSVLSARPEAQP
jgi:hypothetical protein